MHPSCCYSCTPTNIKFRFRTRECRLWSREPWRLEAELRGDFGSGLQAPVKLWPCSFPVGLPGFMGLSCCFKEMRMHHPRRETFFHLQRAYLRTRKIHVSNLRGVVAGRLGLMRKRDSQKRDLFFTSEKHSLQKLL